MLKRDRRFYIRRWRLDLDRRGAMSAHPMTDEAWEASLVSLLFRLYLSGNLPYAQFAAEVEPQLTAPQALC